MVLFLVLTLAGAGVFVHAVRRGSDVRLATLLFVLWVIILSGALIALAWATGERPRWHWGD